MNNNPYTTPNSRVDKPEVPSDIDENLEGLALGQKLIIYSILCYFVAVLLNIVIRNSGQGTVQIILALAPLIVWLGLSIVGFYKVLKNIKMNFAIKIIYFIMLFVPLINLLALLGLNSRASKILKKAGYKIGLLGAKLPQEEIAVA